MLVKFVNDVDGRLDRVLLDVASAQRLACCCQEGNYEQVPFMRAWSIWAASGFRGEFTLREGCCKLVYNYHDHCFVAYGYRTDSMDLISNLLLAKLMD